MDASPNLGTFPRLLAISGNALRVALIFKISLLHDRLRLAISSSSGSSSWVKHRQHQIFMHSKENLGPLQTLGHDPTHFTPCSLLLLN
ncbi:hypothetical protein GBA52_028360 [Prunus armeniaca]|nr:hypothetical protein GBA52_028360 [Prunus armeniaca]